MSYRSHFLVFAILLLSILSFGEGTKELMPDSANNQRAYILIANGNAGGAMRDPFALYNGDASYRLYIRVQDYTKEKIYFGVGAIALGGGAVTWRIHRPDASVLASGTTPSIGQQGFIRYFSQAYAGPTKIDPSHGYPAIAMQPQENGDFFITFQVSNNNYRIFEKIDISVIDTTTITYMKGRVHSRAWQLSTNEPSRHYFYGKLFVYTNDGVVDRFDPNGFDGMWFTVSCNESGCYPISPTHNAQQARQSTYGWHNYPQYKIFLNNPDTVMFPSGIIGQLVPNSLYTVTNCDSGSIYFIFQTTALGTAEITLELNTLGAPYVNRILVETVTGGTDTIVWDGKDGNGVEVPNGSTFMFTMRYYNGLTHLPLWDVEGNSNGFKVNLVRPQTIPPIPDPEFFWDDSQVGGTVLTTPPGCTSTSTTGCHAWNPDWGDLKTINTWWYVVSTSSDPVAITYKRSPEDLGVITGPNQVCQGGSAQYSVSSDPNSQNYIWSWPGGVDTTGTPIAVLTFPVGTPPGPAQVTVHGYNTQCGNGPVSSRTVTVLPIPAVAPPFVKSICSGTSVNLTLSSDPTGALFSWTTPPPTCTANIQTCPPGQNNQTLINDLLALTNSSAGTVTYHVTPTLAGCSGTAQDIVITVNPLPVPTFTSGDDSVCLDTPGHTYKTESGKENYLWTIPPQATTTSGGGMNDDSVTLTWNTVGNYSLSVNYTEPATQCTGASPTSFAVTVNPLPVPTFTTGEDSVCLNIPGNVYATETGKSTYIWTIPPEATVTAGGTTNDHTVTLTWTSVGNHTLSVNYTEPSTQCTAASPTPYDVFVKALPVPTFISGDDSVCLNTPGHTYGTESGKENYLWIVPPEATVTEGGTVIDNIVVLTWNALGSYSISVNYTEPATQCTAENPTSYPVFVKPLPLPTFTSGEDSVCLDTPGHIYETESGKENYLWILPPEATVTSGGGSSDNSVTITWNTVGNHTISVNYTEPTTQCTGASPTSFTVTVKPLPVPTFISGEDSVCLNVPGNIYETESGKINYLWTIPPEAIVTAGGTTNDNSVTLTWTSPGDYIISISYTEPSTQCSAASPTPFAVTVKPLPSMYFSPGGQSICSGATTALSLHSDILGTTFAWTATGSSPDVHGYANGSGDLIQQTLTNTGYLMPTVTYLATPVANGCTGASQPAVVTVNPLPMVSFTACFDTVTTTEAQPILLKGAIPTGGTFSGTGVAGSFFYPGVAGPGRHRIKYTYTNDFGCVDSASLSILNFQFSIFNCGDTLTDPRDSSRYPTVLIGTQCWMANNLNYGITIASTQLQRDNCINEKYCFNDNPANCISYGGLYQWNEVMCYTSVDGAQGLCPPGWRIPSEADWNILFSFFISSGFAGNPLKEGGYSGFNALMTGTRFHNSVWKFSSSDPILRSKLYWSSTRHAPEKACAHGMNEVVTNTEYTPSVSLYPSLHSNAFSVRCLKE